LVGGLNGSPGLGGGKTAQLGGATDTRIEGRRELSKENKHKKRTNQAQPKRNAWRERVCKWSPVGRRANIALGGSQRCGKPPFTSQPKKRGRGKMIRSRGNQN